MGSRSRDRTTALPAAPDPHPLSLYVGTISSEPQTLLGLLHDLRDLASSAHVARLVAVILDNVSPADALPAAVKAVTSPRLEVKVIGVTQQRIDAARGAFGPLLRERGEQRSSIATARSMLQKYLGTLMSQEPSAYGWLLDDDMRVDARSRWCLSWLPSFRDAGIDVLIGAIEGKSPNPPLHGIQGQLLDLLHNLTWLRELPATTTLPDRSAENDALRARFPDYYYDLSRKHTEHLHAPHWLEAATEGELVGEAYARLVGGAPGILSGAPLTRPLIAPMPATPLTAARDSVNRGGHTFVLNHRALTETPNLTPQLGACEARRSDMFWAIVNRYYRGMTIKAVNFPVVHVGRATDGPAMDLDKVVGELFGAALYAALTDFMNERPGHQLDFSPADSAMIRRLTLRHRDQRLDALFESIVRIGHLRDQLRATARPGEFTELLTALDTWFTPEALTQLRARTCAPSGSEIEGFLTSLRAISDAYASAPPFALGALHAVRPGAAQ